MKTRLLLALLLAAPAALAQTYTVTIADGKQIANPARAGLNVGEPTGSTQILKHNFIPNPGFECEQIKQIWQTSAGGTLTTTQWQANINNQNYFPDTPNQWVNATFTVVQGPEAGYSGIVTASSANQEKPNGPVFTVSPASPTPFSAGDVIVLETNSNMPNVCPTSPANWTSGQNGVLPGAPTLTGGASIASNTDSTDLSTGICTAGACGQQSVAVTVGPGAKASFQLGAFGGYGPENTMIMSRGKTYTASIVLYSHEPAASIPNFQMIVTPRSGTSCASIILNGNSTPPITATPTNFSFKCSFAETVASNIGPVGVAMNVTPAAGASGTLDIDNFQYVQDGWTNPTAYTDDWITAVKAYCQSTVNTTGSACTLRYGPDPESESMTTWILPQLAHHPESQGAADLSTNYVYAKTSLYDFLQMCAYVGAVPVVIQPITFYGSEEADLIDFLEGGSDTPFGAKRIALGQATPFVGAAGSPFTRLILEIGNENWNGVFLGLTLGFRFGEPNIYSDYATRAGALIAQGRARQAAQKYDTAGIRYSVNMQTGNPDNTVLTALSHPDLVEGNGYTANNIADVEATPCTTNATCPLYGPSLAEPWSNTHDPDSQYAFHQFLAAVKTAKNCGASGTAPCVPMVYEENVGVSNGSTKGPFTQPVSDIFAATAVQGIISADQILENGAAGVDNSNAYQAIQYFSGDGGVIVQKWGVFVGISDACAVTNAALFGGSYCPRPQVLGAQVANWAMIGPEIDCGFKNPPTWNVAANNNSVHAINGVPLLRAYCFRNGNQRAAVVVNADVASSYTVNFSGTNPPTTANTYAFQPSFLSLSNNAPAMDNTSTYPATMNNVAATGVDVSKGVNIPAHSVTAFSWSVTTP